MGRFFWKVFLVFWLTLVLVATTMALLALLVVQDGGSVPPKPPLYAPFGVGVVASLLAAALVARRCSFTTRWAATPSSAGRGATTSTGRRSAVATTDAAARGRCSR